MTDATDSAVWVVRECVLPILKPSGLRKTPELVALVDAGDLAGAYEWLRRRRGSRALPDTSDDVVDAALNALLVAAYDIDGAAKDGRTFSAGCAQIAAEAALAAGLNHPAVVLAADGTPIRRAVELVRLLGLTAAM